MKRIAEIKQEVLKFKDAKALLEKEESIVNFTEADLEHITSLE